MQAKQLIVINYCNVFTPKEETGTLGSAPTYRDWCIFVSHIFVIVCGDYSKGMEKKCFFLIIGSLKYFASAGSALVG